MIKPDKSAVSRAFPLTDEFRSEAEKFLQLIKKAKRILISSTLTSDGDSIGSQIGIYELIRSIRKDPVGITIVNESAVPSRYRFLKNTHVIKTREEIGASARSSDFDLGIVCDGGVERTGNVQDLFESIRDVILVDHHAVGSERDYASKLLDLTSSSTCELVYHLYEFAGVAVSPEVAEHLFVGIVFDTGFFKHSLTTPRTHFVASHLIATGIDFSKISDRAILERSWEAQLLLKTLLGNMERSANGKIISSYWTDAELKHIRPKDGDQEGMINQLYFTEGAEVVALFTEKEDGNVKISFRSKGKANVAEFARTLDPQGGGHVRAAGCQVKGDLARAKTDVIQKLTTLLSS